MRKEKPRGPEVVHSTSSSSICAARFATAARFPAAARFVADRQICKNRRKQGILGSNRGGGRLIQKPRGTPRRFMKMPFPPPSPAKHITTILRWFGHARPREGPIPEDEAAEADQGLDKNFGYSRNFGAKFELGKEVGRGHFDHTCQAKGRKGELKDQTVAVKVKPRSETRRDLRYRRSSSLVNRVFPAAGSSVESATVREGVVSGGG